MTTTLSRWTRDRTRGEHLPLEPVVRTMTAGTAALYGLRDRGRPVPGLRADLNVIDHARLRAPPPEVVHDLPGGCPRLIQRRRGTSRPPSRAG